MKLLIVDDEELTRTGVVSSIDWQTLGINQVLQADDGVNGLELARSQRPEIILCDVRMPRMDGITMLERLEEILPDCVPIFMSGYSDKEYLKAAIKLKAVNYIEKPLNPQEIQDALQEAVDLYHQKLRSHRGETLRSMETASRLALQLTTPYGTNQETISQLAEELSLSLTSSTWFTAMIVKLNNAPEAADLPYEKIYQSLNQFLHSYHLDCIYLEKRVQYLVYEIFGPSRPGSALLDKTSHFLKEQFAAYGECYLTAGDSCLSISKAYHSYASAVVLLQNSFFFPPGTFLTSEILETLAAGSAKAAAPANPEAIFSELLLSGSKEKCEEYLASLFLYFNGNHTLLPNQAKDFYYKLFILLEDARKQKQLISPDGSQPGSLVDTLEKCFSYQALHLTLEEKVADFFADAQTTVTENPTIFLIRDYISKNYMIETLSVKDISSHVFLSASYVCTFFKNETGQTLNQYLTEYRMEKAKQLLCDPRYKITDISSRVGYNDGNYFGKSFKKYTGLSPSEFREKMTS